MNVSDVMQKAIRLGACDQSGKATDWKSLCWLFFTPQGREFCENNNFPSIEIFRDKICECNIQKNCKFYH